MEGREMFRVVTASLVLSLLAVAPALAESDQRAPVLVSFSANHGAWTSDASGDGAQSLAFTQVSYDSEEWGVLVSGVFAKTDYQGPGVDSRFSLTTPGDVDLASYYNYKDGAFTLQGGLDVSLPTGKAGYTDSELEAIFIDDVSADLMLLSTYGAGLNIMPHALAVYKLNDTFTLGAGVRYEINGAYDPGLDAEEDEYDPGDRFLAVGNGVVTFDKANILIGTVTWSQTGTDTQSGKDVYRQGDTIAAELRYLRAWSGGLSTILSLTYQTQGANESLTEEESLGTEISNSNNNSLEGYLNLQYRYSKAFTLRGLVGAKGVGANGYGSADDLYDAGRMKWYFEPGVQWSISDSMYLTGSARYSQVKDKKDAFAEEDATYNLYNIDIGIVYRL